MRSSTWHALGNVYLLVEGAELTAEIARTASPGTDGVLEVVDTGPDWAEIRIWNPDGSLAEMSGNGTRIAARWLAESTGAKAVTVRVGALSVAARMLDEFLVEQDLGEVTVWPAEQIAGVEVVRVSVGNPHAVVRGDPAEIVRLGVLLETHPRFPDRTNVQVARLDGPHEATARVWERGVGETSSSGTSAIAVAAALGLNPGRVRFPGGALDVRFEGGRAFLTGPAQRL
ncbi:MAG: diaminopimelate epimerase [Actinobacteria bacterium]|nr:diaminopimelate epimerase [Actinomycetota bacterium]